MVNGFNEIRERLNKLNIDKDIIVSTNDNFIETEIIRPFLKDTSFGKHVNIDFIVDYTNDINDYEEGLNKLKGENVLGSYRNNLKKNFKFELAKKILINSIAARQYLESKYTMLFLDEYQDSDSEMHDLFMYIKHHIKIKLFIVGDEKQAIYLWRGARRNIFNVLQQENFERYVLTHNFRCHPEITNFANFIHHPNYYIASEKNVSKMILCNNNLLSSECVRQLILDGELDINKEITVLLNVNRTAESFSSDMKQLGYDFVFIPKTPIDEGLLNSFLLRQIANLYFDSYFSIYDFCEALMIDNDPRKIKTYEQLLKPLMNKVEMDYTKVKVLCESINGVSDFTISEDEIVKLTETLMIPDFEICFVPSDSKLKVMTVFASKGLEFDQVVAFASDYILNDEQRKNNHYVAITRAKEKMIIINNNANIYINTLQEIFRNQGITNKDELQKIIKLKQISVEKSNE